jgi:hypothetical protein
MVEKCYCESCGGGIEFDPAECEINHPGRAFGKQTDCPHCGQKTLLFTPDAAPSQIPKPGLLKHGESVGVKAYLNHIRENSNYLVLRGVINTAFALLMLGVVVGALLSSISEFGIGGKPGIAIVASVVLGVFACIIIAAAWQSALLLVDVADTLIHEHSKSFDGGSVASRNKLQ